MKTRNNLKALLIQIRNNPKVRAEELNSFARYSNIELNQLTALNVFDTPRFKENIVDDYDLVFVGGASECSVTDSKQYPFINYCKKLLLYCIKIDKPVFASCYGFQLAVLALGGEIYHVDKDFEMGCIPIKLTKDAFTDPIFNSVNNNFLAVSVHQDKAIQTPNNCSLLAYTDECIHAFRFNNKPFWCTQFHPEVDKEILVQRLTTFADKYTDNKQHLRQIIEKSKETPESNLLLKKFIDYVLSLSV